MRIWEFKGLMAFGLGGGGLRNLEFRGVGFMGFCRCKRPCISATYGRVYG